MQKLTLAFVSILTLSVSQYAQAESISRAQAETLMAECKVFRTQKIEPLKAIEIDKCINEQGKEAETCSRLYDGYGETHIYANGNMQMGLFWDSPICDKALTVEKYFKMHPGKDKYEKGNN
ncbi:hypothetical protein [Psychromonas aquimarina]|uniref:hypothetical protein n=1 Tax=Psychromonas aquimarina TaxID=444919 RepID=UPI000425557D|nr:hypothetical protein [Psychromonas aquimarina]